MRRRDDRAKIAPARHAMATAWPDCPRICAPFHPHHVTARGNRREPIFFEDGDQDIYCDMLAEQTRKANVEVWAYCLMPNHVHLILYPHDAKGLSLALGAAHKRWANFINGRGRWRGHLFDGNALRRSRWMTFI